MTEEQRKRLAQLLVDPTLDEQVEALEAPPMPLEPELEARLVEAALRDVSAKGGGGSGEAPSPPHRAAPPVDEVAARRRRTSRFIPWMGGFAAVAAGAVLLFRTPPPPPVVALVPYQLQAWGSATDLADDSDPVAADAAVSLKPGGRLKIVLRPERRGPDDVVVQSYLCQAARCDRWNIDPRPTGAMVFRINLPRAEIPELHPGRWDVVFVLGHRGRLPAEPDLMRLVRGESKSPPTKLQVLRKTVIVEGP